MAKYNETMTGTTGSTFTVIGKTEFGRIGIRKLDGQEVRVRVEPAAGVTSLNLPGWKSPGAGQNRYSTVVTGPKEVAQAVVTATKALKNAQVDLVHIASAAFDAAIAA